MNNSDVARWFQYLPGWIALLAGWFIALVGWAVRIEKILGKVAGRQDELTEDKEEASQNMKELSLRLQAQGDSIVELKTDVRYIREGIDELKRRRS